ncbi:MAG: hypothetical protein CML66_26730 [Rhodobacteraceae bacterium]|nr:hypothetical protein [Paracoccaceae bacterium]
MIFRQFGRFDAQPDSLRSAAQGRRIFVRRDHEMTIGREKPRRIGPVRTAGSCNLRLPGARRGIAAKYVGGITGSVAQTSPPPANRVVVRVTDLKGAT